MSSKNADSKLNSTKAELDTELAKISAEYKTLFQTLEKKHKALDSVHEKFPKTFLKDTKYEDLVLVASRHKHEAIQLLREVLAVAGACKTDSEYLDGQMRLYSADTFLKEVFDKVTDSLRNSFVNSNPHMRKLKKALKGLESLSITAEKLVRAFEADEVNFRRFHQVQGNITGL